MVAYTFSKLPTANFNTTPPSIARSATGSVYDVGDTGFTTPLNMTLVVGGAVVTTISSDALGFLPDFTLDGRVNCVWKQTGSSFATTLTTSDPIPGPPGPNTIPTDTAIATNINDTASATRGALNDTYVPKWKPNTAYLAGDAVLSPAGDTVTAKANFTSGASYNAANWNLSKSFASINADGRLRAPVAGVADMSVKALINTQISNLNRWAEWCRASGAIPWIGEFGWPIKSGVEGERWDDVADAIYSWADAQSIAVSRWAARKNAGDTYAVYGASGGIPGTLDTVVRSAQVIEAHNRVTSSQRGINFPMGHLFYPDGSTPTGNFDNVRRGNFGTDYTYGSAADYKFLADRGYTMVRLTIRWERLQPTLNAALDATEVARLHTAFTNARAAGLSLLICPKNQGCYYSYDGTTGQRLILGDAALPASAFADFWGRMATEFGSESNLQGWDLCNEPGQPTVANWKAASQAAVSAIRAAGDTHLIVVAGAGTAWGPAPFWTQFNGKTGWVTDPANNFAYDTHLYPWGDSSAASLDSQAAPILMATSRQQGALTVGIESMSAAAASAATISISGNHVYVTYFTAPESRAVNSLVAVTGSTVVGGRTLCRMSLAEVNPDGVGFTVIAETANDTTLFANGFTRYSAPFDTSRGGRSATTLEAGKRYAIILMDKGSSGTGVFAGQTYLVSGMSIVAPAEAAHAQPSDIWAPGATVAAASLTGSTVRLYVAAELV